MKYVIAGLGNPGEEYKNTRHNIGREALEHFRKLNGFPDFIYDKKRNSLISKGKVGKHDVTVILPETFMNKSGISVKKFITNEKDAQNLIVIHDDIDLPIGKLKIVFGKGGGGHKGVGDIIKSLNTKDFIRLRIGIMPQPQGNERLKQKGNLVIKDFVLDKFSKKELGLAVECAERASDALSSIIKFGRDRAMNDFN